MVIVIISALLGLLLPALAKARARGRITECAAHLRQIGMGFKSYMNDSGDIFPHASYMPSMGPAPLEEESEPLYIAEVLAPHLSESERVFACPMDIGGEERLPPNQGKPYFQTEKSSYEYRMMPRLGGQSMAEVVKRIAEFTERILNENVIWIMRDYNNFHGSAGSDGSRRYLYHDGRVSDYEN
jgi:hypothetical protein